MNNVNIVKMQEFVELAKKDSNQAVKEKSVSGDWVFQESKPQFVAEVTYQKGKISLPCELPPFAGGWGSSPRSAAILPLRPSRVLCYNTRGNGHKRKSRIEISTSYCRESC